MRAFLTGSRVYGKPNALSDVDLVVVVAEDTEKILMEESEDPAKKTVRFGRLNLIVCRNELEAAVWKVGTHELKHMKELENVAYDKVKAKEKLDVIREAVNILDRGDSGTDKDTEDSY